MGCNRTAVFVLIAVLFAAATPPAAYADGSLSVSGRLCCTAPGNCTAATGNCPGQGLSGQVVQLKCSDGFTTSTVGENINNGEYRINLPCTASVEVIVRSNLQILNALETLLGIFSNPNAVVIGCRGPNCP